MTPLDFSIAESKVEYLEKSEPLFQETGHPIKLEINKKINEMFEQDEVNPKLEKKAKELRLPELYYVGIVHGTYIICQNDKGMYMIDQHAAKERINYEKFLKQFGEPNQYSLDLLVPITIELTQKESIILKENIKKLIDLNFKIEEFGINTYIVKAHPTWLPKNYEEQAIKMIIDIIINIDSNFSIEKFNESLATTMSCKLAIKANQFITQKEAEQLINDLRTCDNPFNCPHGRPVIIHHSNYEIEKMFKRTGF